MRRGRRTGITLIEILIVVSLLALAVGGTSLAFGAVARANLRSSCMKVLAACRYAFGRSLTQGTTVRVLFDFDNNTMAIQEAEGRVTLQHASATDTEQLEDADSGAVDPWEAARSRIESALQVKAAV